jgi:F-type H+-transporting ATPase subunit b
VELLILGAAGETMGTAIGTSLVLLVSFLTLLLVLSYFVWKPVKKIMDDREQIIHDDIDSAEQRRVEAERLKEENEALLKQTQSEISELMENAKGQAKREQESIINDAQTRASQMIQEAKGDIEREKEQAIRDINDQVAELSVLIAEKMIVKEINQDDQKNLVKKYLQEAGDK